MQSLTWYWNRLRSMPPGEIWWRIGAKLRDEMGKVRANRNIAIDPASLSLDLDAIANTAPIAPTYSRDNGDRPDFGELIAYADDVASNRLNIFNLRRVHLGDAVDWNRDYASGKSSPLDYAPSIDYRDFDVAGDAKFVWEPNRHQHLVVLARAYRATGEPRYAEKVIAQLESWIEACPFGNGMNWRSPLELAIRLINWCWALDMIAPSGLLTRDVWSQVAPCVELHVREIESKYSRYSSANNHLIGEAAGVFVASRFFKGLPKAAQRAEKSRQILIGELERQTYADGGNREQALGYHMFALEFFVLAGLAGRATGMPLPASFWSRLEGMFDYLAAFAEGGEQLPMYGDCDDGYVLDVGGWSDRPRSLLALGAALFDRPAFADLCQSHTEPVYWLLGDEAHQRVAARVAIAASAERIESRALTDSGYYLLQAGSVCPDRRISLTFDCGDLGFGSLAAHGHADALSTTLRAFGEDLLVDPGTYDYFTYPEFRDYFRSTRAHNTVVIDDQDQSVMSGSFLWGKRAAARLVEWRPRFDGGRVVGEHDGYMRLGDPVTHRRAVELCAAAGEQDGVAGSIEICDRFFAKGEHRAAVHFHFSDQVRVEALGDNRFVARGDYCELIIEFDADMRIELATGSTDPIRGWVSRGYHQRRPATMLAAHRSFVGNASLTTRMKLQSIGVYVSTQGETTCQAG